MLPHVPFSVGMKMKFVIINSLISSRRAQCDFKLTDVNYNIVNTSLRGKYFECEMSGITRYLCLGVTMFLLLRALVKKTRK